MIARDRDIDLFSELEGVGRMQKSLRMLAREPDPGVRNTDVPQAGLGIRSSFGPPLAAGRRIGA
jgi:hypothetical protein